VTPWRISPQFARGLRKRSTDAENVLWHHLRDNLIAGKHFRRQHQVGNYVVDLICIPDRVVIEVDGSHHFLDDTAASDAERTTYLESLGIRVLRFNNREVLTETESVISSFYEALSPSP
jgi:very-short-patch-repair endonuclease